MILIDFNNISYPSIIVSWNNTMLAKKSAYTNNEDWITDTFEDRFSLEFRTRILEILLTIKKTHHLNSEDIILAIDSKKNWRKKFFPEYKNNRKVRRDNSEIDWKLAFDIHNQFIEDLTRCFYFKTIKIDECEADDIIATYAYYFHNRENILIISDDIDFYQLHKLNNIKQINYKNVEKTIDHVYNQFKIDSSYDITPELFLQVKIINGDKKDGVPNIFCSDDVWTNSNKKAERLGYLTSLKIIQNDPKTILKFCDLESCKLRPEYTRNKKCLDLSETPEDIKQNIINAYLKYKIPDSYEDLKEYLETNCATGNRRLVKSLYDFIIQPERKRFSSYKKP